jgi:membrane-associated phospholipid phosphatase
MSYYLILPSATFLLIVYRKWETLERMALSVSATFYVCYLIFVLYPVVGPRIYLESIYYLPFDGPVITPLVKEIVSRGGLHGGAMPSSHCAVALIIIWNLSKEFRSLTFPLTILLTMLCISTVYGRFHYLSDVVVGLLLGIIMLALVSIWHRRFLIREDSTAPPVDSTIEKAVEVNVEP